MTHRTEDLQRSDSGDVHEAGDVDQPKFSRELQDLVERFDNQPVCLGDLLQATHGRGYNLLLVLLSLPFLSPIPLPGFSIPFGIAVALIGTRMALGQKPWLPQRLLQRQLPARFLGKVLGAASRIVRFLEWFLRARLHFFHEQLIYRRLAGALIALAGLCLLLPLPVPFSNGLPAWTILLLAAAALERDGLCFLAGAMMFVVTACFFTLLAFGGVHAIQKLFPFGAGA